MKNNSAIILVPVFSYDLCSVKMTLKDLIKNLKKKHVHPSNAFYRLIR